MRRDGQCIKINKITENLLLPKNKRKKKRNFSKFVCQKVKVMVKVKFIHHSKCTMYGRYGITSIKEGD